MYLLNIASLSFSHDAKDKLTVNQYERMENAIKTMECPHYFEAVLVNEPEDGMRQLADFVYNWLRSMPPMPDPTAMRFSVSAQKLSGNFLSLVPNAGAQYHDLIPNPLDEDVQMPTLTGAEPGFVARRLKVTPICDVTLLDAEAEFTAGNNRTAMQSFGATLYHDRAPLFWFNDAGAEDPEDRCNTFTEAELAAAVRFLKDWAREVQPANKWLQS